MRLGEKQNVEWLMRSNNSSLDTMRPKVECDTPGMPTCVIRPHVSHKHFTFLLYQGGFITIFITVPF